jgi:hypothetical protein
MGQRQLRRSERDRDGNGSIARVDAARDECNVVDEECAVDQEEYSQSDPRDAKVLVYEQDEEPHAHDEALLDQEGRVAPGEQLRHQRVALAAASLQPGHGEAGVHDVQGEDG